ncbi:alkaline phosphatase family protein [Sporosarcina limicola]|uniref:AlkP superfamily pyrophosphatase or phosphodiesterase n=1 Tax=Sporosarcina limicola TaxID=34101 RepID=A0A927MIP3_9BACL|nr:alkaline phosphatase family protein [Sporosarcina limicola]MBE1555115.1 putative AlkP superfamily pyrophosphatase or phosphodiesterase [Sporosarcina limicola]
MSNDRVVLIVVDALRFDTACTHMGYMQHLVERNVAARYEVRSEVPSLSRPLYETILTGTPPIVHGVTSNYTIRLSTQQSLFHLARSNGKKTAAAAYYWVSELYNRAPFNFAEDRLQMDKDQAIENGIFYFEDHYPDSHLFSEAAWLLQHKQPDFLYIHPMNVDNDGHLFTADSKEYRNRVLAVDNLLSLFIPQCLEQGYEVVVTADHGMTADGNHGGNTIEDRHVPMFIISDQVKPEIVEGAVSQLQVAPLICRLLAIEPSIEMVPLLLKGM